MSASILPLAPFLKLMLPWAWNCPLKATFFYSAPYKMSMIFLDFSFLFSLYSRIWISSIYFYTNVIFIYFYDVVSGGYPAATQPADGHGCAAPYPRGEAAATAAADHACTAVSRQPANRRGTPTGKFFDLLSIGAGFSLSFLNVMHWKLCPQ